MSIACGIASFASEAQSKREVMAVLTGSFPRGRPLPPAIMMAIGDMLPEIRGNAAPVAGLALRVLDAATRKPSD